jgi:hypothetical protein
MYHDLKSEGEPQQPQFRECDFRVTIEDGTYMGNCCTHGQKWVLTRRGWQRCPIALSKGDR